MSQNGYGWVVGGMGWGGVEKLGNNSLNPGVPIGPPSSAPILGTPPQPVLKWLGSLEQEWTRTARGVGASDAPTGRETYQPGVGIWHSSQAPRRGDQLSKWGSGVFYSAILRLAPHRPHPIQKSAHGRLQKKTGCETRGVDIGIR